ncbi:MAG: protein translocase subunit SecF [Gammaproteobacteria bacterium]
MEFFKQNTEINFMRQRKAAYVFSAVILIASIVALAIFHLNLGLDFTGGLQLEMHFPATVDAAQVRQTLHDAGYEKASVIRYGSSQDIEVTLSLDHFQAADKTSQSLIHDEVNKKIKSLLPSATIERVDYVGPQVGKQLAQQGMLAVIISLIGTMIYISLRFERRFAVSSTIALIHDPLLILGIFAAFHIQFDLISLTALLTVIGYSLNDTIVIFDRVRENFRRLRKAEPYDVMNISINQTLSRTIMTSGLTLIVLIVLYFFGGPMLRGFSLAFIIGIVIGTYSSIYVAGALAIAMGLEKKHLMPVKLDQDARP